MGTMEPDTFVLPAPAGDETMNQLDSPSFQYLTDHFAIAADFERFDQKLDIYNRAHWDPAIDPKDFFTSYNMGECVFRKSEGFTQWDFALRNASWHLADWTAELKEPTEDRREGFSDYYTLHRPGARDRAPVTTPEETTERIKKAARFLGSDLVGVCEIDKRWVYSRNYSRITKESKPLELPEGMDYAIVTAVPMDFELSKTYPSSLGGSATGMGYTHDLIGVIALAQFIRNLGYRAIASLNDTALSIPMAIQAGLGEYGKLGLLITKEYGPRVRIGKVFTDLPLVPDRPIEFGVKPFCDICQRCSRACPVSAIPLDEPQTEPPNHSSHSKITKWTVDAEKCFGYWVQTNTECAICIRVCPYNKDYSKWWARAGRWLAGTFLRKLMLRLDILLGFGQRVKPVGWWGNGRH